MTTENDIKLRILVTKKKLCYEGGSLVSKRESR